MTDGPRGGPPATPRGEGLEGDSEGLAAKILDTFLVARGNEDFGVFWKLGAQNSERMVN